jgi:hypothetical protein
VTEAVPYFVAALAIPVLAVTMRVILDEDGKVLSADKASKEVI